MDSKRIARQAQRILKNGCTQNMERLAKDIGITVRYSDGFQQLLGAYTIILRNRYILLNNNLNDN